jgi:hypothetical protein
MRTLAVVPALAVLLAASSAAAQNDLQPPPPLTPGAPGAPQPPGTPQPASSTPSNADDESDDSGLGLEWVWLRPEVGFSYVDMESLGSGLTMDKTHGAGPFYGGAIGARLLFLTVGARLVNEQLSSVGNLWDLGGEIAFHMRIWRIDPYFGVRAGWTWLGGLDSSSINAASQISGTSPSLDVHGFAVGPAAGIDLYFAHLISIGADAAAEFMFLQRPPPKPPEPQFSQLPKAQQDALLNQPLYKSSGSSVGLGTNVGVHVGLHF